MAKENKEVEEERTEVPKQKPKFKLILIALISLTVIASGSIAAFYLITKANSKKAPSEKPAALSIWPMDPFVVNIAETNGERYLRIVIQLETSDPETGTELEQIKPRIRDTILDLLTPKTYKELNDLAGKQRLREDIAGRINNVLQRGKVTRVYFTEFVIQ